jgi:membrane associated rhomboid family serine protease
MATPRTRTVGDALEATAYLLAPVLLLGVLGRIEPGINQFGIRPREWSGLIGVICSPFLHTNMAHLTANAVPLFVLLMLLFWDPHYFPRRTLLLIWFASGLGTWLIGRGGVVHIGASSIVYGLIAYLVFAGILMRRFDSMLIGLGVFLMYGGGIFAGVVPQGGNVSWEGHLCGAVAGVWVAFNNHDRKRK